MKLTLNSTSTEVMRLISGSCFDPLPRKAPLSEELVGKSFTSLYVSSSRILLLKVVSRVEGFAIVGIKRIDNDKSLDFPTFLEANFKNEAFRQELRFGVGCIVNMMPQEFSGESISPSNLSISPRMPTNKTNKPVGVITTMSRDTQLKWLEIWLKHDAGLTTEKCSANLTISPAHTYSAMLLPALDSFILGGIHTDVIDLLWSLDTITPILNVAYLPFQLLQLASKVDLFAPRVEGDCPEYSGLWGVYFLDFVISFAWRKKNMGDAFESFFGTAIKYCAPQQNSTSMRSALDTIFRESAASFVRNVLVTSATITANPDLFQLFCTDTDVERKAQLLPVLENSLMRPVTPLQIDTNKLVRISSDDSRISADVRFLLTLQLAF